MTNYLLSVKNVRKELRAAVPDTAQYNAALEQNRRVTEAVSRAQKKYARRSWMSSQPNRESSGNVQ